MGFDTSSAAGDDIRDRAVGARRLPGWIGRGAIGIVTLVVVLAFLRFHDEETGWTYLLDFGTTLPFEHLPEVEELPVYFHQREAGYDGCFYAQLALRPTLQDPALGKVIDNPPYRARRILLPWLAALIGGQDAWRTLGAYALLNLATWLALGVLLLRWIDITRPDGVLRWCGVMLSAGMLGSLRHALTDGPALLAVAGVVALIERGWPWLAAIVGGTAGLVRETGILVVAALMPFGERRVSAWCRAAGQAGVVVAPIALWMAWLQAHWSSDVAVGDGGGLRNLSWPFVAFVYRWRELIGDLLATGGSAWVWYALLNHFGLTVQAAFVVSHPRWKSPVWRIGAVHLLLFAILNTPVWEGYPGAAARVLLPLTFAFNLLAPRGRFGLVLLIAGNLGVFAGMRELQAPAGAGWQVVESPVGTARGTQTHTGRVLTVRFDDHFYGAESDGGHTWRWTDGDAAIVIRSSMNAAWRARLRFGLRAVDEREVAITVDGHEEWRGKVGSELVPVDVGELTMSPEALRVDLVVGEPSNPLRDDPRRLGVAVYDVVVEVTGPASSP